MLTTFAEFEFSHTKYARRTMEGKVRSNGIGRMNGEIRGMESVKRRLVKMDTPILKGYQIFHNRVGPHEGLNRDTPAYRAGKRV